jgi:hypothetical protein
LRAICLALSIASFWVSNVPDARDAPAFLTLHFSPLGTTCWLFFVMPPLPPDMCHPSMKDGDPL